jgi:hypothetical protein
MNEKITKLCWNEFGWIKPSGSHGKSSVKKTHEKIVLVMVTKNGYWTNQKL